MLLLSERKFSTKFEIQSIEFLARTRLLGKQRPMFSKHSGLFAKQAALFDAQSKKFHAQSQMFAAHSAMFVAHSRLFAKHSALFLNFSGVFLYRSPAEHSRNPINIGLSRIFTDFQQPQTKKIGRGEHLHFPKIRLPLPFSALGDFPE